MKESRIIHYVDPSAVIGAGTSIWHFAVILARARIGQAVSIGPRVEVGADCVIGDGTRIGSGTFLPPGARIGRRVFIGPNVTMTDDRRPRAGNVRYLAEPPVIEDGASIGAGATILPGVRIGAAALIGAGAIVTRDVAPGTIVRCEPARFTRRIPESIGAMLEGEVGE